MNYSSAILSQWDQFYPIEAWAADDFSFEDDTYINGVNWIGFYTSKSKCQDDQFDMQITFFLDRGDGCAPGDVAYGPIFFPNLETNETFIENYWYSYNITFTESILFLKNMIYWISIQAVAPMGPEWGIGVHTEPILMHEAVYKCAFFGVPDWEDAYYSWGDHYNMCFQLEGFLLIPPSAPVIIGPNEGVNNTEYMFYTNPLTDPLGESLYCQWDWDDGNITDWLGPYSSGSNASASHSWAKGGIYEIRAQLKGIGGQSNWSEPHIMSIFQNSPPIANFTSTVDELTVTLDASSSYDPDGVMTDWLWDFGDGTEGAGEIITHIYQTSGTYRVTLTVIDDYGDTAKLTKNLSIEKYQKAFIVGRLKNPSYVGDTIAFTAINLKVITFQPFTYTSYSSGEHIIILNSYTGHLGFRFIFAFCTKMV